MNFENKKLLVLGGKPIGSVEIVKRAKELGLYVVVTDFLPIDKSPAKQISDESWDVSTADIDILANLCREHNIDGITTAVHEFNINRLIELCELLGLPSYLNRESWKYCDNKLNFKNMCNRYNIPVAKQYEIDLENKYSLYELEYPLIIKPADGSGSRGFSICHSKKDILEGYSNAIGFSPTKTVIIEDYIPYESVIIHYTMIEGKCFYSGISDKYSSTFKSTGASVMGLQVFPSTGENTYIQNLDVKVRRMFESEGFTNGPIWIEAFFDGTDKFIFNEMGYRFGGSLTYYPVNHFYNINQLDLFIESAFGKSIPIEVKRNSTARRYCILPIHIKSGIITSITGVENIKKRLDVEAFVYVHNLGDEILEWGSAQQVFAYLHVTFEEEKELRKKLFDILNQLEVIDENGNNMLFTLFDIENVPIRMN